MANKSTYKGQLERLIIIPKKPLSPTLLTGSGERMLRYKEELEQYNSTVGSILKNEYSKKIPLLLEHYKIDNDVDMWKNLAICLAKKHVKGFQVRDGGKELKPKTWGEPTLADLYIDYLSVKKNHPKKNISALCLLLSKMSKWSAYPPKTIHNRLNEAKSSALVATYNNILQAGFESDAKEFIRLAIRHSKKSPIY